MHSVMGGGGARVHSRRARAAAAVPFTVLVLVALDCCGSGGAAAARVAVIGDYGFGDAGEQAVVQLIKAWDASTPLTAVATLGNNNMPGGLQRNIAARVGGFYGWAMAPAPNNRFWPSPGSHDWGNQCGDDTRLKPYLDYFAAIGVTQSVYDVRVTSDIHLFMLDSDCNEPMGRNSTSQQADWLKGALAASDAPLKLVLLHHAPFSSSLYGSDPEMQWPFEEWGADAVLAAHDHTYERLLNPRGLAGRDGFPYFVNGLGGAPRFPFKSILPSSKARYNGKNGAMLLTSRAVTSGDVIRYELDVAFYAAGGAAGGGGPGAGATAAAPRDCYRIIKTMGASLGGVTTTYAAGCPSAGDEFSLLTNRLAFLSAPSPGQAWSYYVGGKLPPTSKSGATWVSVGFDDSAWPSGPAPLGYGADPPGGSGWATALATNTAASGARYYYLRALVCLSIEAAAQLSSLPVGVRVASGGPSKVYLNKNLVASDAAPDRRFVYWNAAAQVKKGLLVAGPNVIAAQVSDSAGAPGSGFDLDLVYSAAAAVGSGGTGCGHHSLLAARDAAGAPAARPWRFYSAGAAALTSSSSKGKPSWLSATFDDSVWAVVAPPVALGAAAAANAAAAPIAQGAPQQADTAVSGQEKTAGPVAAAANHAAGQRPAAAAASKPAAGGTKNYYFRMKFCLSTDVAFKLSLSAPKLTVSAGARVYINGALAASDPSGGKAGGGSGRITKDLKKRALVAGLNVIAVQVSDMGSPAVAGFDIDLSYLWNEPLVASFLPESCQ